MTAYSNTVNNHEFRADTSRTLTAEHIPGSALVVDTTNGSIEVIAEPDRSDVSIKAHLHCRGTTQDEADQRLAATTVSVARAGNRTLIVKPIFADKRGGGDGASFSIRIPDADGVRLDTSNGSVVARALAGSLVIDTSNGSIRVTDHDGTANVDTSNGAITLTTVGGAVDADTTNGAITLTTVGGPVDADTTNGAITLTNVGGPVDADTSNGAIRLTLADNQGGPLKLDTSNGSIMVQVGPAFVGTVRFDTSHGSIHVEDQAGRISSSSVNRNKGRGSVSVGDGGPASRLDTSHGAIHFTIVR
jgi:hypothetical protein